MSSPTLTSAMAAMTSVAASATTVPACDNTNGYTKDDLGVRVSAVFVILVGSFFGAIFPVIAQRNKNKQLMPPVVFFIAKYFGSGVIVATAFIHLLAPASDSLTDPCLTGPITEYDWAEGIALMTVFLLFFVELLIMRSGAFVPGAGHSHAVDNNINTTMTKSAEYRDEEEKQGGSSFGAGVQAMTEQNPRRPTLSSIHTPNIGEDHLGHARDHTESNDTSGKVNAVPSTALQPAAVASQWDQTNVSHQSYDDYAAQMTAIFVLEFGIIFHSIFIGLTLAVTSAEEFPILYVVLVFHQTFEGLGLGTRLAVTPWSNDRRGYWTPFVLGVGYALTTPIAIAIGLGVRETFSPNSQKALIVQGVFDSISAGILLYTGLVELMAHEFMFSPTMSKAKFSVMLSAFGVMSLGAGIMALLGKWA